MKKAIDTKYPHSANLFQFCRRVLDHKFGGIRVIDQDIGQILGFDPSDCSHWKKGKKNIRSIHAIKSIADHLGVDERLVIDVACGDLDDLEAFCEYSGYGAFRLDAKMFETAKKEFYKRYSGSWSKDRDSAFRSRYSACEEQINQVVSEIHQKINFQEAPLYLPEIVSAYPDLTFMPTPTTAAARDDLATPEVSVIRADAQSTICFPAGSEVRPYMRYRIAKAMAEHFLADQFAAVQSELKDHGTPLIEVQSNLFAAKLLVPLSILRRELAQVALSKDIVSQLSEIFWVSKSFMNRRLSEILQDPAVP